VKASELLKKAEAHLWDGTGDFMRTDINVRYSICGAVQNTGRGYRLAKRRITDRIMSRLDGSSYAPAWLQLNHPALAARLGRMDSATQIIYIQAWRLNWMRKLAAEFAAEGD